MQSFQLQVSLMRLFRRIKSAFADAFALGHNLHAPFSLVRAHPQKPRFVSFCRFSHVLQIAKTRHFAEITKRVVLFISVAMIYMKQRPVSGHVRPRKAMRQYFFVVNCDSPIARTSWPPSTFTYKIRAAMMGFPKKLTSFWAVIKNRSDMFSGNHDFEFTIKVAA